MIQIQVMNLKLIRNCKMDSYTWGLRESHSVGCQFDKGGGKRLRVKERGRGKRKEKVRRVTGNTRRT